MWVLQPFREQSGQQKQLRRPSCTGQLRSAPEFGQVYSLEFSDCFVLGPDSVHILSPQQSCLDEGAVQLATEPIPPAGLGWLPRLSTWVTISN
jgi:hypothetical protein